MAQTGFFHHIGSFLLLAAGVLLLITTISAPVVNDISMLKVSFDEGSTVSFGTFGYCAHDAANGEDFCSKTHVGYNPGPILEAIDQSQLSNGEIDALKALTRVMILHPIACGLAFIAFLLALGAGFFGGLLAAFVSAITFVITVVSVACDFVAFGIVKHKINNDTDFAHAKYGVAIWTLLAAMIVLFFATFIVLFTCCSSRMHKNRADRSVKNERDYIDGPAPATTRRRFW